MENADVYTSTAARGAEQDVYVLDVFSACSANDQHACICLSRPDMMETHNGKHSGNRQAGYVTAVRSCFAPQRVLPVQMLR